MYKSGTAVALVIIAVSSSASPRSLNRDLQEPPGGLKDRIVCVIHSSFQLPPTPDYYIGGQSVAVFLSCRLLSPEKHSEVSSPFMETSEQYFKITKKYQLANG